VNIICKHVADTMWFDYHEHNNLNEIISRFKKFDKSSVSKRIKILNILFNSLCDMMSLNRKVIRFDIITYIHCNTESVAKYSRNSNIGCSITIYYNQFWGLEHYVAAMLHELGHFFIHVHGIKFLIDEELCNDVMLVYMGFGDIIKNAYKPIEKPEKNFSGNRIWSMGYLNHDLVDDCKKIFKEIKNTE